MRQIPHNLLESYLSSDRLGGYVRMAEGDHAKAIALYLENLNQCQLFYTRLHWLEIGLRNAMNRQLSQKYGGEWFNNPKVGLNEKDISQICKAKEYLIKDRKPLAAGNMVAQLNFGFWVNLFNPLYDTLWRHCLRKTFAPHIGALERKRISGVLHPILKLRNRIAHYEPILGYNLPKMRQDITDIIRWIEPEMPELP